MYRQRKRMKQKNRQIEKKNEIEKKMGQADRQTDRHRKKNETDRETDRHRLTKRMTDSEFVCRTKTNNRNLTSVLYYCKHLKL